MDWLVGDIGFGKESEAQMLGYDCVTDMNTDIVNTWNTEVDATDTVYVVGNLATTKEDAEWLQANLNGNIVTVSKRALEMCGPPALGNMARLTYRPRIIIIPPQYNIVRYYEDACVILARGSSDTYIAPGMPYYVVDGRLTSLDTVMEQLARYIQSSEYLKGFVVV